MQRWWTQISTFYNHHLSYLFNLFYHIIYENRCFNVYFSDSQIKTANRWNLAILDWLWSKTSEMSKVYWNSEDTPYLTQQIRHNIIRRWIPRPLSDFEECAACDSIMRRIWNFCQRRRSSSFYSRYAALYIWHTAYPYQDFTRTIQDIWRTCATYKIKLRRI